MTDSSSSNVCELCNKQFTSLRALKGHNLHCRPVEVKKRASTNLKRNSNVEATSSNHGTVKTKNEAKVEPRSKRKRKIPVVSLLDPYVNKRQSLDPYPLSYIILHGEDSRDHPLLAEARKLFALVYPTIPKDFQWAAVSANRNTKQDFRSFRNVVLSLQTPGGSQVVSCATVKVHANTRLLEILFIATNPTLQRRGFGRLLLHLIEDLVRQTGIKITLACASRDAIPFWQKLGFAMNAAARIHGWRLVQLGGTKVMSQEIDPNESRHRLLIGEALMRVPLNNFRRSPETRKIAKAIPNIVEWVAKAKIAVADRKKRQERERLTMKVDVQSRKGEAKKRRIKIHRKPKMKRRKKEPVKESLQKLEMKKEVPKQRSSRLIDLTGLKRSLKSIKSMGFFLPQDLVIDSNNRVAMQPHENHCHRCRGSGRLLCCDTCVRAWHLQCVDPKITEFPPSEFPWNCPVCMGQGDKEDTGRSTRSNTRQQWNMRICYICRRRKDPADFPEGQWDIPYSERVCKPCKIYEKLSDKATDTTTAKTVKPEVGDKGVTSDNRYARMSEESSSPTTVLPSTSSPKSLFSSVEPEMRCALCHKWGHGQNGEGRLEHAGNNVFVHSYCLRFSPSISFKTNGVKKSKAIREIKRGERARCTLCGNIGATMSCGVEECWNTYHLHCAMKAGCKLDKFIFLTGGSWYMFCPEHSVHIAAKNATKASNLKQWTIVFDKPLEEKDVKSSRINNFNNLVSHGKGIGVVVNRENAAS
eukprot:CAMPEP_0167766466 /NCGR_PEP_ID=MMETSP0110_2-20121227/15366_1 /TAXON_ID=629695 /ORGANISM="Gymnochlora sp., Strain CCMP2014" /LENGTH=753 /DNA_ID=CAMNT_0007654509 /DNA_START=18 /DNA_END=2279 /DNA_ORIENTATION=-